MKDMNENLLATLRDIVFSYNRKDPLPDDVELDPTTHIDPDDRDRIILRDIDLDVPPGTFTVIMGASGCGKSTLLYTFNGLIPNHIRGRFRGDVTVGDRDIPSERICDVADTIGMVMQDYEAQLFGTNVEAEVAFGPENLSVPRKQIDDRIDHALATVGLEDLDRLRSPAALSGGQKQRLVFGSILAMHPSLLVLDEPTTDLDPQGTADILNIITRLTGPEGPGEKADEPPVPGGPDSIVMVTHKIKQALSADRVVLFKDGTVFREGSPQDILTDVEALNAARVNIPSMVDVFHRLGWDKDEIPLTPEAAVPELIDSGCVWTPPAKRDDFLPVSPAGIGENIGDVLFEVENLVHTFETHKETIRAVDDVDLTIKKGEGVAIVGHNGSGKTTLAKHLNGLLKPDDGRVRWEGTDIREYTMAEIGQQIGFVFQNPDHQIFEKSVRDEVEFGPKNFGITGADLDQRVTEALETVELSDLEDSDPFNLSKGQRQRVALASVLATDPDVIIFDEPTTGLDIQQQQNFMDSVSRLNSNEKLTIVMVTHDMDLVARYASRTVVLEDGKKVADKPTRELFAEGEFLADWKLQPPHPVKVSNELASKMDISGALPALTEEELIDGLEFPQKEVANQ